MGIENNSFTFWANMKEAIDVYQDESFRYKLYDALTELGLYGVWPEEDGSLENQAIISFLQSMLPTLQRSHNYFKKSAEAGAVIRMVRIVLFCITQVVHCLPWLVVIVLFFVAFEKITDQILVFVGFDINLVDEVVGFSVTVPVRVIKAKILYIVK